MPKISVIMPIHNEERYLPRSLKALTSLKSKVSEFIFILDRCTDRSEDLVRMFFPDEIIIKKKTQKWRYPISENLQLGLEASSGDIVMIIDADIVVPPDIVDKLLNNLKGDIVSVSGMVVTDKDVSFFNKVYYYWEFLYSLLPLNKQPRGGCRMVRRDILEELGGFKDVFAWDSLLDMEIRRLGYKSKMIEAVRCLHIREITLRKCISGQIMSGKARKELGIPFWRTLAHAIVRLRPLVVYGYIKALKDSRN